MLSRNRLPRVWQQQNHKVRWTEQGTQHFRCQITGCLTKTLLLDYRYKAYMPSVKPQVVVMAINGSGIRDTRRMLGINKNTVISTLKKQAVLRQVISIVNKLTASGSMGVDWKPSVKLK